MKITCNIIKDLLPLYAEDIVSNDTKELIKEHIATCTSCKEELDKLQTIYPLPIDTNISTFKSANKKLKLDKFKNTIFYVVLTLFILITTFSFLTTPNYLPYSQENISLEKNDDGYVVVSFGDNVSNYELSSGHDEYGAEIYEITTWNTFLSKYITHSTAKSFILNIDDKNIDGVTYYSPNSNMLTISSNNIASNVNGMVLPRLFLNSFFMISITLMLLTGIFSLLLFRFKKLQSIALKVFYIPLSYILAHLSITGLYGTTFSSSRDFILIVINTLIIYILILLGINLFKSRKLSKSI